MEELGSMIKAGSLKYVLRTRERFMVAVRWDVKKDVNDIPLKGGQSTLRRPTCGGRRASSRRASSTTSPTPSTARPTTRTLSGGVVSC